MSINIDRGFWTEQTFKLPVISCTNFCYSDFIVAALQNLAQDLSLVRATCLVCVPEEDGKGFDVAGESYPTDHWIEPHKSSELTLLGQEVILSGTKERYLEDVFTVDEGKLFVQVFQVRLPRYETQYALVLNHSGQKKVKLSDEGRKAGFEYLQIFAHIVTSMYLDKADVIGYMRRDIGKDKISCKV